MDAAAAAGRAAGAKVMTDDTQPGSKGKWFTTASGFLTITLNDGDDTTKLIGHVVMAYSVLH